MNGQADEKQKALKAFGLHLLIFILVNALLLVVPVFYDGSWDFNFEDRGVLFYGSIGWGIGLAIHGLVVLYYWLTNKSK